MLEEDYFTLAEMEKRARRAAWTKHGGWFGLVGIVVILVEVTGGDVSLGLVVAVVLIISGALQAYRVGSLWQGRWRELIHEKRRAG